MCRYYIRPPPMPILIVPVRVISFQMIHPNTSILFQKETGRMHNSWMS